MSERRILAPQIHKFGGASVADAAAIGHAVELLADLPARPVVVVSALAGVTDALLDAVARAGAGDARAARRTGRLLRQRYLAAASGLVAGKAELKASIGESFDELERLLLSIASLRHVEPRTRDFLIARGERLAAQIFAAALKERGRRTQYVDALRVVRTRGPFGNAAPDLKATDRQARAALLPLLKRRTVPVVPGFFGAGPDGELTTLGRGGADLTATLLGRALRSPEVSLWKDVAGILTADPRNVPEARVIPQLHQREAAELAYYGARVLHPRALIPVAGRNVAIRVRPFAQPTAPGTEVSRRAALNGYPVKALSLIGRQALMTVAGNGMLGVPGIAARAFTAVQREGASVVLITQASSEHSISFVVPADHAPAVRKGLLAEFREEIDRKEIDGVEVTAEVGVLAAVGMGIANTPGIPARVFAALAEARLEVLATAQGSSELNLSLVLRARDAVRAQRVIHAAFQLDKLGGGAFVRHRGMDVVLLGYGQVGRALAPMIANLRHNSTGPRIIAVIDRSGFVFEPGGLSSRRLQQLGVAKRSGQRLATAGGGHPASAHAALDFLATHALTNPVLVDVTASDTADIVRAALAARFNVVLANKRPLTASRKVYDDLRTTAAENGRRLLHEATVGAGLPIIDTYQKLVDSGDYVLRIEGCPSGTLGFLFGEMGRGRKFSEALRHAMEHGYTEPDPRDDLSGTDVARKALILGRLLGYRGELSGVNVESLVPRGARTLPLQQFLKRLEDYDESWARRVEAARERGMVLRYRAVASRRSIRVGLKLVATSSATGALYGTDNQFSFTTLRYRTNPLVITGPGAGPAVTAGGILNDILKLDHG
ncbi:MAG: aspartate kinase [Gemmatimonadetes bacterium]|nr:aspartate kinase [Gemmatimonadota bacterium]